MRRSTSAGLFRTDTGEKLPGSNGLHVYVVVQDGADIERFLKTLHERCWLAGLGWLMVGAGGQLLERSIVDRMVGRPSAWCSRARRPEPPLRRTRRAAGRSPLTATRSTRSPPARRSPSSRKPSCDELQGQGRRTGSRRNAAKARAAFIAEQAERLRKRTGMPTQAARARIERQCEGVLLPDVVLPFDDDEFAGCTVGDVLADPERFEGATLADPLEGVELRTLQSAKIMRRADGTPWIHSSRTAAPSTSSSSTPRPCARRCKQRPRTTRSSSCSSTSR